MSVIQERINKQLIHSIHKVILPTGPFWQLREDLPIATARATHIRMISLHIIVFVIYYP